MASRDNFYKLILIIKCLSRSPASYEELCGYLESHTDGDFEFALHKRTFQRNFKDIKNIFDITIEYDRSLKKYKIIEDENSDFGYLYEAIEVNNALSAGKKYELYMYPENRNFRGIHHLSTLLKAIVDKKCVQFDYTKFSAEESETKIVQPLLLKQFKLRWYLLAYDNYKQELRVYGLDRMSKLEILKKKFKMEDKNFMNVFKYSFGIIYPKDFSSPPPEIKIEFTKKQAKYYETLPLHSTQKIEYMGDKAILTVQVYPTVDFLAEIISNGDTYRVLSPDSVREQVKEILKNALKNNK